MTTPDQELLQTICAQQATICKQQTVISQQLSEVLEVLTRQPDTSLIEQLSELLQPLFTDMSEIKRRLPPK